MRLLWLIACLLPITLTGCGDTPTQPKSLVAPSAPTDFRPNIISLKGHPWGKLAITYADAATPPYGDYGQWDVIAWEMTSEQKYLDKAAVKLAKKFTATILDPNDVREYFAELEILAGWIWPLLTDAQKAPIQKNLEACCKFSCGIEQPKYVGGWRYNDSDQTIGQYLGILLHDQRFGTSYATLPGSVLARDAIRGFLAKAEGGEWIESSGYNLGTLKILLLGVYAAGVDLFPEVRDLMPDIADQLAYDIAPGNKAAHQWGDDQDPRQLVISTRIPLYAMVAGITGNVKLHAAIADMTAGLQPGQYMFLGWRALYFYQPLKPEASTFFRASPGNGHFRYKRDNALLAVHSPKRISVDHEVPYASDFQLFLDSNPVITHPIGYATPANTQNAPLFAGLGSMQARGPPSWKETPDGCEIVCGTSGQYYPTGYYQPPPAFVKHTRTITFTHPGKVVVRDAFDGANPQTLPLFARYSAADQATIKAAPALWQVLVHCPVKPTETDSGFTWTAKGGKTVTLTAPTNAKRLVIDEKTLGWAASNVRAEEIAWQIRFLSDEPIVEMVTTLEVK